jgi:osmotically-inducible protein OsmY
MKDNNLKKKVEENLARDTGLAEYPIEVQDNNGVITLSGEVPTQELARTADRIARESEGVVTVMNNVIINPQTEKSRENVVGVR